jgi:hypothetical protein
LPPGKFTIADPHVDAATPVLVRGGLSFEVAAGEPCLVLIPVEAAAGIVSVTVVDEHGQPFDRAHVSAHGLPPAQWMKFVPNATAANGKYVPQGIPDEPLMLCIDPRGVPERNLAFFGATNRKPYLELAGPTSGLVVVVNDAYTIRGRAVDAQDQALGGVVLLGTDGGLWHEQVELGRDYQGAPTAPGTFEFRHLRPGKYPLWIGSTEAGPPDAEVEVGPGVTPSHTAEVVLRQRAAPK